MSCCALPFTKCCRADLANAVRVSAPLSYLATRKHRTNCATAEPGAFHEKCSNSRNTPLCAFHSVDCNAIDESNFDSVCNLYKVVLLYLGIICSTHIHLTLCHCYTGCRTSLHKNHCKQQQQEPKTLHPSNSQGDGVFHTTGSSLVATEAAARLLN